MEIIKKIFKYFKILNKLKCPNCKSIELKSLEKNFLNTSSKPYYNNRKYETPSDRMMRERCSNPYGYDEYKVYNSKYQCINCSCTFSKIEEYKI